MVNIPIRDIALTGTPSSDSSIVFDDGQMKRGTVASMADAVRPVASQAESQAGADNVKTMTALRVKQSISSEIGVSIASKAQGDTADSAVQPGDLGDLALKDKADVPGDLNVTGTPDGSKFLRDDGSWQSITGGGDMLAANNLGDVDSASTSRGNLQVGIKGHLYGLTLSTAGSSSSFGIAAGEATGDAGLILMTLASAYTKTTSAWAVGTGNGSLDTGTIANTTWYHVYLIKRVDTGVVDVLISTSATSPTMPTNYTISRRIGAMKTNGSAQWTKFVQDGDRFTWDARVADVAATNPGTSAVTRQLSVPLGVRVLAHVAVAIVAATQADIAAGVLLSDLSVSDETPGSSGGRFSTLGFTSLATATNFQYGSNTSVMTNTSSQIRSRLQISAAGTVLYIGTIGWDDRRGRD